MIEKSCQVTVTIPTVLILGAGASAPLGYPTGRALISDVVDAARNASGRYSQLEWREDEFRRFSLDLYMSGAQSIDAFLEGAPPRQIAIGKFLIADRLKQIESLQLLFRDSEENWYPYIFNCLKSPRPSKKPFEGNRLSVITFNYDRSLETYLHQALMTGCRLTSEDAVVEVDRLQITHVHGVLGSYFDSSFGYGCPVTERDLIEASKQIKIIHELDDSTDDFCSEEFRTANRLISEAERVIFLGFGFHPDNIRRMRVRWESRPVASIAATFSGLTAFEHGELIRDLSVFGIRNDHFITDERLRCLQLFRNRVNLKSKRFGGL